MHLFVFLLTALIAFAYSQESHSQDFSTPVSSPYWIANFVALNGTNSTMEIKWFVEKDGGRTIYSDDTFIGNFTAAPTLPNAIKAHATWVIAYQSKTRTVTLVQGQTHITNWYKNQRCNVFEDGTCNCHGNANWDFCGAPDMQSYRSAMQAQAVMARSNASAALLRAGYKVQ